MMVHGGNKMSVPEMKASGTRQGSMNLQFLSSHKVENDYKD